MSKQLIYQENKDLFTKFFDIYNKLSVNNNNESFDNDDENDKTINKDLNPELPLYKFFIIDENELSEGFKYIYKQFIDKHNEIVEKLLKAKSQIFDVQNKGTINIQNITKEDEIFIIKKDISILDILFNCSYRKVLINDDYSEFNKYEINLEYIEEIMTDKLLKNKQLISEEILHRLEEISRNEKKIIKLLEDDDNETKNK